MKNSKVLGYFLIIVAVMAMCAITFNAATPQKTTGTVVMVQPCGWFWCAEYDAHYAEHVNQPNSEANKNNGEANYYNSQAEQTASQTTTGQLAAMMAGAFALALVVGSISLVGWFLHKMGIV